MKRSKLKQAMTYSPLFPRWTCRTLPHNCNRVDYRLIQRGFANRRIIGAVYGFY